MVDWIAARPVAHRGLHDAGAGVIENTAAAFQAAVDGGYAMECDVQISADGEAMVFHDDTLDRLMQDTGRLDARPAAALKAVPMKSGRDRMITLGELCDLVGGRSPLIVEVKASWNRDRRLERRVAEVAHDASKVITSMMHANAGRGRCVTVYIVEGDAEAIQHLTVRFKGLRDTEVVRTTYVDPPEAQR